MYLKQIEAIGIIRTPHLKKEGMPIQPAGARGIKGQIILEEKYEAGLKDLDGFSHIMLLYHFHNSEGFDLEVVPFLDHKSRGLFATRAPRRPNQIGLSVVKLRGIRGNILDIEDVDMMDGTPLLDIKPYVGDFDQLEDYQGGWTEDARTRFRDTRSDERFS